MTVGPGAILRALVDARVEFVLIGPLAARARGADVPDTRRGHPVEIVPQGGGLNLQRLVDCFDKRLPAQPRLAVDGASVLEAVSLEALTLFPTLPLTTPLGNLTVVLKPVRPPTTYRELRADADPMEVDGVTVAVAGTVQLLDGLAAGTLWPDVAAINELRVASPAGSAGRQVGEMSVARLRALERDIVAVVSHAAAPVTVREIVVGLGGRPHVEYRLVRRLASRLAEVGVLSEDRGKANQYRINSEHESRLAEQIIALLSRSSDPIGLTDRALASLADQPEAVAPESGTTGG